MGRTWRLSPRRWRPTRFALAVQDRYSELHGGELASAITLSAFLSLLPVLLVGIAVFGFFSAASSKDLAVETIKRLGLDASSDTANLITEAIRTAESSRNAASVVGLAGLLWTGLGGQRPPVRLEHHLAGARPRSAGQGRRARLARRGGPRLRRVVRPVGRLAAAPLVPDAAGNRGRPGHRRGLWLWTAHTLPNRQVGWRALLPGALLGAAGFEILKMAASVVVPRIVERSSDLYGPVGVVFAVLAWLLVFGRLVVYSAVVEVVIWEKRHGTVQLMIEAPARPGVAPVGATRAGEQRFSPNGAKSGLLSGRRSGRKVGR